MNATNTQATYTAPSSVPQQMSVTLTCSAGSVSATAAITVTPPPAPTITSVTPTKVYCIRECFFNPFTIRGSGFKQGQTLKIDPAFDDIVLAAGTKSDEIGLLLSWGSDNWQPGVYFLQVCDPTAGCSNTATFLFLGNLNPVAVSATHAFHMDQGAGKVRGYRLDTGEKDHEFDVGQLKPGIAVDNETGFVVLTQSTNTVGVRTADGGPTGRSVDVGHRQLGAAARNGFACLSQDQGNQIVSVDLRVAPPPVNPVATGDQPHPVAMAELAGQLVCAVYNREDRQFKVLDIPSLNLRGAVSIVDAVAASALPAVRGGWHLVALSSGSAAGLTALLAHLQTPNGPVMGLVIVDISTSPITIVRTISLPDAFRIWADEAEGAVWVANTDGTVDRVSLADFSVSRHPERFSDNFLPVGFAVSSTHVWGFMDDKVERLAK